MPDINDLREEGFILTHSFRQKGLKREAGDQLGSYDSNPGKR
jgi:hypothetical protein